MSDKSKQDWHGKRKVHKLFKLLILHYSVIMDNRLFQIYGQLIRFLILLSMIYR